LIRSDHATPIVAPLSSPDFALCAQDAGLVLRTSSVTTRKSVPSADDEQRKEADRLGTEAMRESKEAARRSTALMQQGLQVMRNVPWTAELEFASSLRGQLDPRCSNRQTRDGSLAPLYTSERTSAVKTERICIARSNRKRRAGKELAGRTPVALPFTATW